LSGGLISWLIVLPAAGVRQRLGCHSRLLHLAFSREVTP
jgi:hypothetical protein